MKEFTVATDIRLISKTQLISHKMVEAQDRSKKAVEEKDYAQVGNIPAFRALLQKGKPLYTSSHSVI